MANNKIRKKEVLKWLSRECKKLSEEDYTAYPKEFGVPEHLEFKRKVVAPHWYPTPANYKANHKRRAHEAYKNGGLEGVAAYFEKKGFKLSSINPELID